LTDMLDEEDLAGLTVAHALRRQRRCIELFIEEPVESRHNPIIHSRGNVTSLSHALDRAA
jgi:hypothetical protein